MRVAFISDIHSNMIAFKEALDDLKKERPDKIVFLGDYITDGPNPNRILEKVREFGDFVLLGNREKYMLNIDESREEYVNYRPLVCTYRSLSKENLNYLADLMSEQLITVDGVKILLIHGNGYFSQYFSNKQIYKSCDELMDKYDFDVCVFGHTHVFVDFEYKGKRFINPGSIGIPADNPTYKYLILNIENGNISYDLREFETKKTFDLVKNELEKSDYYRLNKIWCLVNLKIVETGIDYCQIFLDMVDKHLKGEENVGPERFNQIWEDCFLELESKGWQLCKK